VARRFVVRSDGIEQFLDTAKFGESMRASATIRSVPAGLVQVDLKALDNIHQSSRPGKLSLACWARGSTLISMYCQKGRLVRME
jgi:hypothetical protein